MNFHEFMHAAISLSLWVLLFLAGVEAESFHDYRREALDTFGLLLLLFVCVAVMVSGPLPEKRRDNRYEQ